MDHLPNLLPQPPPPPPALQLKMPGFHFYLVLFGTTGILLLIILTLCMRYQYLQSQPHPPRLTSRTLVLGLSPTFDNQNIGLMSSFKYKKGQRLDGQDQQDYELECPVCLSVVEEGEEVRQLPRCKHSFHVPCIDMWLYSHFNCPVCRAPVEQPVPRPHAAVSIRDSIERSIIIDTSNLA